MRIYIDIAHPAYAHALRFFIEEMQKRGHKILVSARDKDITFCLLRKWGIPFVNRGKGSPASGTGVTVGTDGNGGTGIIEGTGGFGTSRHGANLPGISANAPAYEIWWRSIVSLSVKVLNLFRVVVRLLPLVRKFRPDLVVSYSSYHAALIGRLLGCPVITYEDTENVPLLHMVNRALSSRMVTPACFEKDFGSKHIRFAGYKELASLHPARFKPLPLAATFQKPWIVLRFVSWRAWHDRGHAGINEKMKHIVAERLSDFGQVYISSEDPLSPGLYRYGFVPDCVMGHSLLAGARLFFGESASMAAEAAVLGVPAIFIDDTGRGFTRELERKHGLLYNFGEDNSQLHLALDKAVELLQNPDLLGEWQQKRLKMLEGKIDVTAWMVELAEGWMNDR